MTATSPYDYEDVEAQRDADEVRKQEIERLNAEDFKWLMSRKEGRRFMWNLLSATGLYQSSFTGNSETFFREGKRAIGLELIDKINTLCPKRYEQMVTEQQTYGKRNDSAGRGRHKDH